jgi:hypothetical protein
VTDTQHLESTSSTETKDSAKEQAQTVAATTKDEATNVVDTAKEQARAVTSDLREQTRRLTDEAREQLVDQAFAQRDSAVGTLRSLGDELSGMADRTESPGLGAQLTREAGGMAHKSADFLQEREPGQLVEELRGLARRRPGAFLLGAAFAGLLVGRVTRGAKSAHSTDSASGSSESTSSAAPAERNVTYAVPIAQPLGEPDAWGPDSPVYPASVPTAAEPGVIR